MSIVQNGLRYGRGVQYFIGDFDGQTFTCDDAPERIRWLDYRADFYANISWHDLPDERQIWVGWMSNWSYAPDLPTPTWQGALTLPREVSLRSTPEGIQLIQQPIREVESLRHKAALTPNPSPNNGRGEFSAPPTRWRVSQLWETRQRLGGEGEGIRGETLEIIAEFEVPESPPSIPPNVGREVKEFGLRVRSGEKEETTVGYNLKNKSVFVDRTHSGKSDFHPDFAQRHSAKMEPLEGKVRLHIFLDHSSLELFANDGLVCITERIFPSAKSVGVEPFADGGVLLTSLEIYELQS